MSRYVFAVSLLSLSGASSLRTLVYGPGSLELRLLSAKLHARAGGDAAVFAGDEPKVQRQWRNLLYGDAYGAAGVDEPGRACVIATTEALGAYLAAVEALVVVCDSQPLSDGVIGTLMDNSGEGLQRVVLVSGVGVTRAKPAGPFGLGGEAAALLANEKALQKASAARAVDMSIIRVGTLKGGGPGADEREGGELGLSKAYYNGLVDLTKYMMTQSYDRFTNGAKVTAGDPFDPANPLMRAGRSGSFDPYDDEASCIVTAGAVCAALRHPSAVELTVSAAKGEEPPTEAEWAELFAGL